MEIIQKNEALFQYKRSTLILILIYLELSSAIGLQKLQIQMLIM